MALRVEFPDSKNQIKLKMTKTNLAAGVALDEYGRRKANEIENYMKSHRPWTDRTGNARRGLRCDVSASKMKRVTTLELKHSVYYGVYLEYGMGQRFAIIQPTIRIKGPEIMRDMQGFINGFNL